MVAREKPNSTGRNRDTSTRRNGLQNRPEPSFASGAGTRERQPFTPMPFGVTVTTSLVTRGDRLDHRFDTAGTTARGRDSLGLQLRSPRSRSGTRLRTLSRDMDPPVTIHNPTGMDGVVFRRTPDHAAAAIPTIVVAHAMTTICLVSHCTTGPRLMEAPGVRSST